MRDNTESPEHRSGVPFHEQIAIERDERGLTQKEVAEAVGMSLRAYNAFENGHTKRLHGTHRRALRAFFDLDPGTHPAAGEDFRDEWPKDVMAFSNFVGAFLMTMDEDKRPAFIHGETRRWLELRNQG